VGRVQRHVHVFVWRDVDRQIGQRIADGDWLDKRAGHGAADVSGTRQRLGTIKMKSATRPVAPDESMNAFAIPLPRRKQINNAQIDGGPEQILFFVNKSVQGSLTCLISRRDDLEDGDDPVIADVAYGDRLFFVQVPKGRLVLMKTELRRRLGESDTAVSFVAIRARELRSAQWALQGQNVGPIGAGELLRQGVEIGAAQQSIDRALILFDPRVMEIMKDARF